MENDKSVLHEQACHPGQKPSGMTPNLNVGQVLPDNKGCSCPPCGESAPLGAKGGPIKEGTLSASPSALQATSSAREEGNGGFTLIELLVVVLIIGILAAVALPQYQLAVDKARYTEYRTLATNIGKAAKLYYMTHGEWPADFKSLDVNVVSNMQQGSCLHGVSIYTKDMYCCLTTPHVGATYGAAICGDRPNHNYAYQYIFAQPDEKESGYFVCLAKPAKKRLCESIGGQLTNTSANLITADGVFGGYYWHPLPGGVI